MRVVRNSAYRLRVTTSTSPQSLTVVSSVRQRSVSAGGLLLSEVAALPTHA